MCLLYCIIICMCVCRCAFLLCPDGCAQRLELLRSVASGEYWSEITVTSTACTHTHTLTGTRHPSSLTHTPPLPHGRTTNSHSHYVSSMMIFSDPAGHSCNTDYQTVCLSHLKTDTLQRSVGRFQLYVVIIIFNQNCLKKRQQFVFSQSWIWSLSKVFAARLHSYSIGIIKIHLLTGQ